LHETKKENNNNNVEIKTNYTDGKRSIRNDYDFLILDMTLPFDDQSNENKISTAGIDILEIMKHRNIINPCIILTQYDTFGKHESKVNLNSLTEKIHIEYGDIVKAVIFYDSANGEWKEKLKKIIKDTF
jgi:hypothetical protein